jgi:hypothetical protein
MKHSLALVVALAALAVLASRAASSRVQAPPAAPRQTALPPPSSDLRVEPSK